MTQPSVAEPDSFPRRHARSRRFTLGAPRSLRVSRSGDRVAFLRSPGGYEADNSLWVIDVDTGVERLVADASSLGAVDADLPAEELARRERARESGGGIVSYDCDEDLRWAVFTVGGALWRADLATGAVTGVDSAPAAYDPRLAPDGSAVAYVAGGALRVSDAGGDTVLLVDDSETVTWGLAEFVAGEEMGRTRGHWWAPTSDRLLVERVDVAPVTQWWIASPIDPSTAPKAIRYPAAGSANASVDLAIVGRDGSTVDVSWTDGTWEYLCAADWTDDGLILAVQSRDQRSVAVLDVDPVSGQCAERHRIVDDHWVELVSGAPRLHGDRLITLEDLGAARRLCVDGAPLTGGEVQVLSVVGADDEGVVVEATTDSTERHVARVGWDSTIEWLTTDPGVHFAVTGGSTTVVSRRDLDTDGALVCVHRVDGEPLEIVSHAASAGLEHRLTLLRSGASQLATAVLLPAALAEGSGPLPVLLDPYGGPHAQRVQRSRAQFDTSQWFADQGFAVVVADGRGTPARGPAFERSVRGDLATMALDDQIEALQEAARHDERLDLTRVAIRGWSFGGYLAALAVLRRPDVFHAAVAGAPVTDWRLYDTHYTERYLGDPRTEPDNYEHSSLVAEASSLSRPLLLVHGLADDNVVAAHTLELSRALLEAGRHHEVLPLSGVTHMTPQEAVAENLLLFQLEFLRRALSLD